MQWMGTRLGAFASLFQYLAPTTDETKPDTEGTTDMKKCPKCEYDSFPNDEKCPICGTIYPEHLNLQSDPAYRKALREKETLNQKVDPPKPKLIACPDCDNQVSIRATSCPHCGCPIAEVPKKKPLGPAASRWLARQKYKPKCPTCGSINIGKISLKSKIGMGALVGVFAIGHIAKTFKCNSCGAKW